MNALLKQCLPIYRAYRPFQSQRICSEHCFAGRPVGEASLLTHLLRHQSWRATCVMKVMLVSSLGDATAHPPSIGIDCAIAAFETLAAAMSKMTVACMFGICSSALCKDDCKDDEASGKTEWRHEHADTELNSVPEWFEQKMLRNDTIFQAQTARANFCSFPIENVKDAQIETNSKVKLSKNMWLQTSNWHIPNS